MSYRVYSQLLFAKMYEATFVASNLSSNLGHACLLLYCFNSSLSQLEGATFYFEKCMSMLKPLKVVTSSIFST